MQGDPVNYFDPTGQFIEVPPPDPNPPPNPLPIDDPDPQGPSRTSKVFKDSQGRTYKNVGNTGGTEKKITNLVDFVQNNIDPDCLSWLTSSPDFSSAYPGGFSGGITSYLGALLGAGNDGSPLIGFAKISDNLTGVLAAVTNSGVEGLAIIFNVEGSALSSSGPKLQGFSYNNQIRQINPGSQEMGVFVLLHEFAHSLNVPGFQSDYGNDFAGQKNNDAVWQHCSKTLGKASN